jgi:hypothetical protein
MKLSLLINKFYTYLVYLWVIYLTVYFSFIFKVYSFKKIAAKLSKQKTSKRLKKLNLLRIITINRAVIKFLLFSKNCFIRSFTLFLILKKFGYIIFLNIGIIDKNKFESHAWVEYNDIPLLESKDVHEYIVIKKF